MQCPSCGTPLPAGAQACPSCGRRLSPAPSNYPTYGYSNNIPYAPPGEIPPGQPPSGPQPSATPPPYPYPPSYSNPQLYTQAPPFSDNPYQQFPSYIAQPPPPTQAPPPQRRGLTALLIASIVIVVLLFSTVGGYIYYTQVLHPSQQSDTNPPAGTATQPTTLPGGLTPTTSQNSVSTSTATTPQDLYTQATSGTPINLQDGNWVAAKGNCAFTGTTLHATFTSTAASTAGICANSSLSLDNFAYQARVNIVQGSLAALVFRFNALSSGAYAFAVTPQGVYVLESVAGSSQTNAKILAGANSSTITPGLNQSNLLTVIARGTTINIYINKQFITTITDSTSSSGQIGVLAGASGPNLPVDVAFSEMQAWKL